MTSCLSEKEYIERFQEIMTPSKNSTKEIELYLKKQFDRLDQLTAGS